MGVAQRGVQQGWEEEDAGCGMENAGCGMEDAEWRMPGPGTLLSNAGPGASSSGQRLGKAPASPRNKNLLEGGGKPATRRVLRR